MPVITFAASIPKTMNADALRKKTTRTHHYHTNITMLRQVVVLNGFFIACVTIVHLSIQSKERTYIQPAVLRKPKLETHMKSRPAVGQGFCRLKPLCNCGLEVGD